VGESEDGVKKRYILPKAEHIAGATIIQQLGLDTEMGLQRMLQIMLVKMDPESKGITISLDDINHAYKVTMEQSRKNWLVKGEADAIFMKMCTDLEMDNLRAFANATKPRQQ
jgi:hypothetical protein